MDAGKRLALASIRDSLAFFGHDVGELSDDELAERVIGVARTCGQLGLTTSEAIEHLTALARAMQPPPSNRPRIATALMQPPPIPQ